MEHIAKLLELSKKLPEDLTSDWEGTNHFELTAPKEKNYYWWLVMSEVGPEPDSQSTEGQRLGLIMDIAEVLKKAEPELKKLVASDE